MPQTIQMANAGEAPPAVFDQLTSVNWWLGFLTMCSMIFAFQLDWLAPALFLALWVPYAGLTPSRTVEDLTSVILPWLFPILALASFFWSDQPADTMRAAIQTTLTIAIAVIAGSRVEPRLMISALLIAELAGALVGIALNRHEAIGMTGEYAFVGIHPSKNWQGLHTAILFLVALGVAADRLQPRLMRLAGLFGLVVGVAFIIQARSVGAAVAVMIAAAAFLGLRFSRHFSYAVRVNTTLIAVVGAILIVAALVFSDQLDVILNSVGKDSGLTGRATLWNYAFYQIDQNPWFGTGYYAFWRQGLTGAESLWAAMKITARMGFHFHNLYLHYAVDLGIIGAVVMGITAIVTCIICVRNALIRPESPAAFIAAWAIFIILRSPLEVDLGFPFLPAGFLFTLFYVMAVRNLRAITAERTRPQPALTLQPSTQIR